MTEPLHCPYCGTIPIRVGESTYSYKVPHKPDCYLGSRDEETSTTLITESQIIRWNTRILPGERSGNYWQISAAEITYERRVHADDIQELLQDMWDHPSKYSDYGDDTEASYYSFLKYIWVYDPEGKEYRIRDLIKRSY